MDLSELPAELKARLDAAGVTDEATLMAALEADADLKEAFGAWMVGQMAEIAEAAHHQAMEEFVAVQNGGELMALAARAPFILEDEFIEAAEALASELEAQGEARNAAGVRERLAGLRQIRAQVEAQQAAQQSPVVRALIAFVQADDEAAARAVFDAERALLQPYEAQRLLDEQIESDDPATQQRIGERRTLLGALRGAGQPQPRVGGGPMPATPQATFHNDSVRAEMVNQVAGNQYVGSPHAEGAGSVAQIINHVHEAPFEPRWYRPQPRQLERDVVAREEEMAAIERLLRERHSAAISSRAQRAALQGMAGVGKTVLASLLALRLDEQFPGGILWQDIGSGIRSPEQVSPFLSEWAWRCLYAHVPQKEREGYAWSAEAVRELLAGHGALLVVLDDVWDVAAVQPLVRALPPDARLLVTTRLGDVAKRLAGGVGGVHNVDVLTPDEALALVRLGLGDEALTAEDHAWIGSLIEAVGRHAMALAIAVGSLGARPGREAETAERIAADIRAGTGFGELPLIPEEREQAVEAALKVSYDALPDALRRRFRLLGAMAPDAAFDTAAAAALWGCEEGEARDHLYFFARAALLTHLGDGTRWQQHALLRAYALALLRAGGEWEAAAARHAALYAAAMREADDAGRFYQMLPAMPQLRHAFAWAIGNDLAQAQDLIAQCETLMAAFGLAGEALDWCQQALAAAHQRGNADETARAWGSLGNALQRMASLPGDRAARLNEALAAYDAALLHYRPEVAPLDYAMTQNNRATVLSEIATLPGEDRRARLLAALAAYDAALLYRRPEVAPLAYAATQNNRANRLSEIATLPGEDRRARLLAALQAAWAAVSLYRVSQHAQHFAISQRTFRGVRATCGDDFAALWAALGAGPVPDWLEGDENQNHAGNEALVQALLAFLNSRAPAEDQRLLAAHPALLDAAVEPLLDAIAAQYEGDEGVLQQLAGKRALLQACREQGVEAVYGALAQVGEAMGRTAPFQQALQHYLSLRQAAAEAEASATVEQWQAVADAGEALLGPAFADLPGINHDALRESVASTFNALGNAHDRAGDRAAALAAFDRAIALQPGFAMWHRNRCGTLIELARLDEAEAALATARALEPEAARLAELEAALAAARERIRPR